MIKNFAMSGDNFERLNDEVATGDNNFLDNKIALDGENFASDKSPCDGKNSCTSKYSFDNKNPRSDECSLGGEKPLDSKNFVDKKSLTENKDFHSNQNNKNLPDDEKSTDNKSSNTEKNDENSSAIINPTSGELRAFGDNRSGSGAKVVQGGGFVFHSRALYSKYDPQKVSLVALEGLKVHPGTLFIVPSPVLCYGLEALIKKLDASDGASFIVGLECEKELFEVASEASGGFDKARFLLLDEKSARGFVSALQSEESEFFCRFKKVAAFPGAGSSSLHKEFYDKFFSAVQSVIFSQLKNAVTLMRLGKRYSVNFFRNLAKFDTQNSLAALDKSVEKPILVIGAGLSAERAYFMSKAEREKYFVICADVMAAPLSAAGFEKLFIVSDECQAVIRASFLGLGAKKVTIAHSLCAAPLNCKALGVNELFYATEYFPAHFIKRLNGSAPFPPILPPLGSVGLTAVEIALRLRKSERVPIFTLGLDFSFIPMKTHARGASPLVRRVAAFNRLSAPLTPVGTSTPNLSGYKALFFALYKKVTKELP